MPSDARGAPACQNRRATMPRIPKLAGLEGNIPKLAALRFLCWMHLMSAVIIPFFREWGRLSFVQIFALQTWFMLACFLMEVPTGAVADRFGRKVSVACGGFLLAAASLLYGSFPHLAVFVVGRGPVRGRDHAHLGRRRGARVRLAPRPGARGRGVPGHGPARGGEARRDPRRRASRRRGRLAVRGALADAAPGGPSGPLGARRPHPRRADPRPERGGAGRRLPPSPLRGTAPLPLRARSCGRSRSTRSRAPPSPGS